MAEYARVTTFDADDAAIDAGFDRVKLNAVVMRGINEDQVLRFAELARSGPFVVRFIDSGSVRTTRAGRRSPPDALDHPWRACQLKSRSVLPSVLIR